MKKILINKIYNNIVYKDIVLFFNFELIDKYDLY